MWKVGDEEGVCIIVEPWKYVEMTTRYVKIYQYIHNKGIFCIKEAHSTTQWGEMCNSFHAHPRGDMCPFFKIIKYYKN